MDTYHHAVQEDLMQASAVIATLVYEAANRKELLPRRALPKVEYRTPRRIPDWKHGRSGADTIILASSTPG
jgi:hypothetical protein